MKSQNKNNKIISKEVSGRVLLPIIDYCRLAEEGGRVGIESVRVRLNAKIRLLSFEFGTHQHREIEWAEINSWLHPDPKRRVEPRHGMGKLLEEVWEDIKREREKGKEQHDERAIISTAE